MVDWDGGGHAGLAAAASGATRRGSWAPGAPDRGSRQRIDGSQLAHSATQDGAEAKTVAGGGGGTRESLGLAAWLAPEAEPSTRGQVWGRACSSAQIGEWLGLHLQPTEATHPSFLPQRTVTHSPPVSCYLHYWKDIETLIGNYWRAGLQLRSNRCTGTENPLLQCQDEMEQKVYNFFESIRVKSMILSACLNL